MNDVYANKVSIYLTVDLKNIQGYFNENDPAPLYKRQISQKLEQYISTASMPVKRYSVVFYKLKCLNSIDRQYAEPLMYALKKHYKLKQSLREQEFNRFKKRTWMLLAISLVAVILCQGFVMVLLDENHNIQYGVSNILDVFSWVLLWHPIDQLLFHWSPHLREISVLKKLADAEALIINNEN